MNTTTNQMPPASPATSRPRYDPLADFNAPPAAPFDASGLVRGMFGVGLLLLGGGVALWVVVMIHRALNGPAELALLRRLTPMKAEDLAITLPAGTIQLPPATLSVISYILVFLLLAIAGRIAVAILREGARLLRSPKATIDPADGDGGTL